MVQSEGLFCSRLLSSAMAVAPATMRAKIADLIDLMEAASF
jgi:hypothetical protein